jgi:hypothetical protein
VTIRGLVDDIILADSTLTDLVPAERWREAWMDDTTPARPFVEYRWGLTLPSVHHANLVRSAPLDLYVHDDQGSFDSKINPVITRLRDVLEAAAGTVAEGASLICAEWQEDGPDGYDDGHRTAVRYTRYRIVGTGF